MKNLYQKSRRREEASVLMVALLFAIVIGITMSSYLYLISNQDQAVVRSQHWNAALDMAEAGIEEGLAQMNASPSDFSANGWGGSGGVYGPVSRTLAGGSYRVSIFTNPLPSVCSTGYMALPITGSNVSRVVKVTAVTVPLFNVGLGAVGNINMNGNGMATDSWNSYSTNLSNNGVYVSTKTSTNGNVASVGGIVNIGNHTIDGNLYLGPTASYASGTNQVLDKIYYDYNVQFPDAVLPTASWPAAPISGHGANAVHDFTSSGTWLVSDSLPITVEAGVTVTLQVTTTSFSPSSISILGGMTNSGTVIMYQDSGSATLSGNAAAGGNRPENFIYYGLPGVTSITLGGTTAFIGAIYAPEASLTLNGGGNSNNLQGSAIVKSVTMNGHYDFHYDESLATYGPARGYTVNSWQEY
jgi:putative adhesin